MIWRMACICSRRLSVTRGSLGFERFAELAPAPRVRGVEIVAEMRLARRDRDFGFRRAPTDTPCRTAQ